ncbi:hypothetical protein E1B28_002724 [Marasmius oreades]|uniref:Uncharacterized protein n=1 Tax=Marasmius oreades TaxID=181124 RepID=A0A9P7RPB7_9AGAR|nr:uncharacterized protein E1B28_002724 [Marasmius oreades]KAG7086796.1 hypothetical protein E1B28_002724 [Marasmius oreades]
MASTQNAMPMTMNDNEPNQQKINSRNIHDWTFNTTGFEKAAEDWQKFYRVCRSTELQTNHENFTFPTVRDVFLARACYDDLYLKVWALTMEEDSQILITGQAGTGKTVAMWYLICRAIRDIAQPIVYVDKQITYVFFDGVVYYGSTNICASEALPKSKTESATLLVFLNLDGTDLSPSVGNRWTKIIQASSNPANHRWTEKDLLHAQIVLPLWTKDELVKCFEVTPRNTKFLNTLDESFDEHGNAKTGVDPNLASRFKSALEQARLQANTHPGLLDHTRKLSVLIEAAITKLGPVVRDVFTAVVNPSHVDALLQRAIQELQLGDLITAVSSEGLSLPGASHRIILVAADGEEVDKVAIDPEWNINIKSPDIGFLLMRRLRQLEDTGVIRSCISLLALPRGRSLAGWLFEDAAQRILKTLEKDIPLVPMQMDTNLGNNSNPIFTTPENLDAADPVVKLPSKRSVIQIPFKPTSWKNIKPDVYLFSDACNTPLMDAILVEFKHRTSILWVLQLTVGDGRHYGSNEGYPLIDQIKTAISTKRPRDTFNIRYVLVKPVEPAGEKMPGSWKLPTGWSKRKGKVFCAYLPLA